MFSVEQKEIYVDKDLMRHWKINWVLSKWHFHHYEDRDDMSFGHDIADPFTSPYIKFHKPSKEDVERSANALEYKMRMVWLYTD
jgi:hypothetical protein